MTIDTNFNQLTAKLDELTKTEVARRSDWKYVNFKRTVTFSTSDNGIYGTYSYPFMLRESVQRISEKADAIKINLFWYEFSEKNKKEVLNWDWHQYVGTNDRPILFKLLSTQNGSTLICDDQDRECVKAMIKEGRIVSPY